MIKWKGRYPQSDRKNEKEKKHFITLFSLKEAFGALRQNHANSCDPIEEREWKGHRVIEARVRETSKGMLKK